jgi:hypothetical protein
LGISPGPFIGPSVEIRRPRGEKNKKKYISFLPACLPHGRLNFAPNG